MLWLNFLHFYQPPTASDEQIRDITTSCYQSWADFLLKNKKVKVTINISACLTERLFAMGYDKLLKQFAMLARRGQIEFVESAAFHPILPLLPEKEIIKQITINHKINTQRLGPAYQPRGFFPPEMAYAPKLLPIIKKLGYHYLLLGQAAYSGSLADTIDNHLEYRAKKSGLTIIFRNRAISQTFVPETIDKLLETEDNLDHIIITATDGELYGHRHWNWWPTYKRVIKNRQLSTLTISEYLRLLKISRIVSPVASSWESTELELQAGNPFALWQHPKNNIHQLLWQLADFALRLNYRHEHDPNHFSSRLHLERGLASCTFWWASGRDFKLFGSSAWSPEEIEKGALELIHSIRTLADIPAETKIKAERIFLKIHEAIWFKHWHSNK